jgi:Fe-S cluster biogenesis protein NfuA
MTASSSSDPENELRERITRFLQRNFPQIEMHGGEATIASLDEDTGHLSLILSGACDGCGISPLTTQAIQLRLPKEIEEISVVEVETGLDGLGSDRPDISDVPF